MLVAFMMLALVVAVNVEARPGGLPDLSVDQRISDCPTCVVTIVLNVEFDVDKAIVKDKYRDEIKKVADFMKKYGIDPDKADPMSV